MQSTSVESHKFKIRPTALNCSYCFAQKNENAWLHAADGPKITLKVHDSRMQFTLEILSCIAENKAYFDKPSFSYQASFHLCGIFKRHICLVWGTENTHVVIKNEGDSVCGELWRKTKLSVLSFLKNLRLAGDIFWLWCRTLLSIMSLWEQFPPHVSCCVRAFLDGEFSDNWIERWRPGPWSSGFFLIGVCKVRYLLRKSVRFD